MTPKEKAIDLVDKFNPYALDSTSDKSRGGEVSAKQCASIAVDEILNGSRLFYSRDYIYWQEVKQELQKL